MYKKFIRHTLFITVLLLLAFSVTIIVIDPFYHYHKPVGTLKPVINDERYQNPGLAEHFSYDSVLVGSSMTQNFKVSELNDAFECDTIKLTFSAIRTGNYKHMFEKAFSTRDVKTVFMGLDIDPLIDTYGNYYFPLPEYLYDDNPWNDVNYILNKSVMFKSSFEYVKANYLDTVPDIDTAYMWTGDFSKESALSSVTWDYTQTGEAISTPEYLENTKMNLENNILPYIQDHADTTFYIFYPPYSLLWWNMHLNTGDLDGIFDVIEYTTERLLEYNNVKLYSFQDIENVVTDLSLYKDYNHYNETINSEMVQWLKEEEYLLTPDTYQERLNQFHQYITEFDYQDWIEG